MIREIIALLFFILSILFGVGGIIGLFRFKGVFEKIHSISLLGTTSILSIFIALLVLAPSWLFFSRITIIILFFLISSPTATYIVTRMYWKNMMGDES